MAEWDQYLFDKIINTEIARFPDRELHIDHFEDAVRAEWAEYDKEPWNIKPNDSRHYLRCRLSEKAKIGNIANPRYEHYSHPQPPDPARTLNWEEVWDEFRSKVKALADAARETGLKL